MKQDEPRPCEQAEDHLVQMKRLPPIVAVLDVARFLLAEQAVPALLA